MTIPEGTPKGLYLYGTVGTGKSMVRRIRPPCASASVHRPRPELTFARPRRPYPDQLMDLFHSTLPAQFVDSRRRVHFHAFMIDVHKRNHRYKVQFGETGDRMGEVARDLAREARVLCFDEFQVLLDHGTCCWKWSVKTNPFRSPPPPLPWPPLTPARACR